MAEQRGKGKEKEVRKDDRTAGISHGVFQSDSSLILLKGAAVYPEITRSRNRLDTGYWF